MGIQAHRKVQRHRFQIENFMLHTGFLIAGEFTFERVLFAGESVWPAGTAEEVLWVGCFFPHT